MKLPTLRQTLMIGRIFFSNPSKVTRKSLAPSSRLNNFQNTSTWNSQLFAQLLLKICDQLLTWNSQWCFLFLFTSFSRKIHHTQLTWHHLTLQSFKKWIPFFSATQMRSTWNMEITSMTCFRGSTSVGKLPPGHVLLLNVSYLKNASFISVELVESANKNFANFPSQKGLIFRNFPKFQLSNTLRLVFCQIFLNFRIFQHLFWISPGLKVFGTGEVVMNLSNLWDNRLHLALQRQEEPQIASRPRGVLRRPIGDPKMTGGKFMEVPGGETPINWVTWGVFNNSYNKKWRYISPLLLTKVLGPILQDDWLHF